MATFGETINLQPYILNWLVNGENSDLATRRVTSEKPIGQGFKKVTYEGKYEDFLNNYLKVESLDTDLFIDRKPYYTSISKGKLLSSLIEYKRRWNINGDSATLKIDYIGFKGDWLVVKTTESSALPVVFGIFNGSSSEMTVDGIDYSDGGGLFDNVVLETRFKFTTEQLDANVATGTTTLFDYSSSGGIYFTGDWLPPTEGIYTWVASFEVSGTSDSNGSGIAVLSFQADTWYILRCKVTDTVSGRVSFDIDEVEQAGQDNIGNLGITSDEAAVYGSFGGDAYTAIDIDYISITKGITPSVVVRIDDPSTGINTGTANDAIVTDVVKGTV